MQQIQNTTWEAGGILLGEAFLHEISMLTMDFSSEYRRRRDIAAQELLLTRMSPPYRTSRPAIGVGSLVSVRVSIRSAMFEVYNPGAVAKPLVVPFLPPSGSLFPILVSTALRSFSREPSPSPYRRLRQTKVA